MRKYYLDNLRYSIVLLVVFYHIIYLFNSVGVITNVTIPGVPQMDIFLYIIYPWFMPCLFLISGISAKYALKKKTEKQFLKEQAKKLLIPSIAGIFLVGWFCGFVTNHYNDMFAGAGDQIPGFIKYFIYCFAGIGPLWYIHQLFVAYLILMLIKKIDKKEKIHILGGKINIIVLFLLVIAVWVSSLLFNTPLIEIYRHGIYVFMFLLGYYVFSHDNLITLLEKYKFIFLIIAAISGIAFTILFWGQNYSSMTNLQHPVTNIFAWFMTLSLIGCFKSWFDKKYIFTKYMQKRSFSFYVLHYPLLILVTYVLDLYFDMPAMAFYFILIAAMIVLLPLSHEIVSRIPIIKTLLLGIYKKKAIE